LDVHVTLHGILRDYLPRAAKGKTTLTLLEGTTIDDLIKQFKIKQTVTAAIDGQQVESSHVLQEGDDVQMFRMIGGG
jgi:sulfur carrier protein ThiS